MFKKNMFIHIWFSVLNVVLLKLCFVFVTEKIDHNKKIFELQWDKEIGFKNRHPWRNKVNQDSIFFQAGWWLFLWNNSQATLKMASLCMLLFVLRLSSITSLLKIKPRLPDSPTQNDAPFHSSFHITIVTCWITSRCRFFAVLRVAAHDEFIKK